MNAVTQLKDQALNDVLADYDIRGPALCWPAANGIENSNYFVQTQSQQPREYVLTMLEQVSSAGAAYVPMMEALYAQGLPIAPPMRTSDGSAHVEIDGKASMLQPRLHGHHAYNPTLKQVCALARFIARMHNTMAATDISLPNYPRDGAWIEAHAEPLMTRLPFTERTLLTDNTKKVRALLDRADVRTLPKGMIHADLFRDNVLFNEQGLTGVLDFHHAANGYWIYDLAVAANDWCTDTTGLLDMDRTREMLRAYHQLRPLEEREVWYFSAFALYAALAFWLSRLTVAHGEDKSARTKNPDEFRRILQHHNRQFFYEDFRRLTL